MTKRICLPQQERDDLIKALKEKSLNIPDLYALSSAERNAKFAEYVGADFADIVNAKFEQAMVSNQKNAMVRWVKDATGVKEPIRRDMLKKVERIKTALSPDAQYGFLEDLAEHKLGLGVTEEEAGTLLRLKQSIDNLKQEITPGSPLKSRERLAYGLAVDEFKNYVGALKLEAEALTFTERLSPRNFGRNIVDAAGTTKALVATLDNSFIGRQGIKTLLAGKYGLWAKTFVDSFKMFGKELVAKSPGFFKERDDAVMAAIRADIYSRPNALNGKYTAAKNGYGLGVLHEEAFPVSYPSRLPLLGRVFKASETAFTGSALKMRADLADAMIAHAERQGVDMLDERNASAFGSLVGSMTGRGELTTFAAAGQEINALMFAPRFLKANFNTLTAHQFDRTMTPLAKRVAATNLLKIAGSVTTLLTVAKMLDPDSVDFDPRSSNFGKIAIGQHRYDITGGMAGLVVLGSRIVPTFHNGEFGFWTKSSNTGAYTKMTGDNYGEQTALDVVESFFEGKASPAFRALLDQWRGQKFGGEKPTFVNQTIGLVVPISAQILVEELQKGNDDILFAMIAEGIGFSSTDRTFMRYGKRWNELRSTVSASEYNDALKLVTERFNERADELKKSRDWKDMDNDQQKEALEAIRSEETTIVLRSYGIK